MEIFRAVLHFLDVAIMWAVTLAQLVTIVPLVLLLIGVPCIIVLAWLKAIIIPER